MLVNRTTGGKSRVDWVPLERKETPRKDAALKYRIGFVPAAGVCMEPAQAQTALAGKVGKGALESPAGKTTSQGQNAM